jgi:hypothetical protein
LKISVAVFLSLDTQGDLDLVVFDRTDFSVFLLLLLLLLLLLSHNLLAELRVEN